MLNIDIVYTTMDKDLTKNLINYVAFMSLHLRELTRRSCAIMLYLKYLQIAPCLSFAMLLLVLVFITQKSLNIQQLYKIIIITLVIGIITTLVLLYLIYKIKNIIEKEAIEDIIPRFKSIKENYDEIMLYLKYLQVILYLTLTMLLFVLVFITQKSLNIQQLYKIIIITLVIGIITTLVLLWLIYKIKNIIKKKEEEEEEKQFII